MARKSSKTAWTPNPECDAACARAFETAHICAAVLWGEKPSADPERDASGRALLLAVGMIYFLARVDPKDMAAIFTGEGSLADLNFKPFPPGYFFKNGAFADLAR